MGRRPLFLSFHVTRTNRYGPPVNPSASCRSCSSGKSNSVASGASIVQRWRSPLPSSTRRLRNGAGKPSTRTISMGAAAPKSASKPLVSLVAATGSRAPEIHTGSASGAWMIRCGTGRPSGVKNRRSASPPSARGHRSSPRRTTVMRRPAASSGTSMARRCAPDPVVITGRSYANRSGVSTCCACTATASNATPAPSRCRALTLLPWAGTARTSGAPGTRVPTTSRDRRTTRRGTDRPAMQGRRENI